jgi:hypothetical protein
MNMQQARKQADDAMAAMRVILDKRLEATVMYYAERNPGKTVTGCSAMGSWSVDVDGKERSPTVFRMFERLLQDYGWSAIPAPVLYEKKPGEPLVRLTDWGTRS